MYTKASCRFKVILHDHQVMDSTEIVIELSVSKDWNSAKKFAGLVIQQTPQGHLRVVKVWKSVPQLVILVLVFAYRSQGNLQLSAVDSEMETSFRLWMTAVYP